MPNIPKPNEIRGLRIEAFTQAFREMIMAERFAAQQREAQGRGAIFAADPMFNAGPADTE